MATTRRRSAPTTARRTSSAKKQPSTSTPPERGSARAATTTSKRSTPRHSQKDSPKTAIASTNSNLLVAASESAPTKATALVDALRAMIVDGRLAPGEKLKLEHLAPRFGVGRTPLREACGRLAAEGFVDIIDQRGFRVAGVSRAVLQDLTRTRQLVEGLALRAAIAHGDVHWEGEVTAALHRLLKARGPVQAGPLDAVWEREHQALHTTLLSACDSPLLLRFCASLADQAERYRRLAAAYGQPTRDLGKEHQAIVDATLARDAERAVALLVEHIARTSDAIVARSPLLAP